uniref:D-glutamate cyclase, mitochondrial-like n=1 Tax=Styela clava TaxID=7725 RepID=UPI00193A3CB6|nr:D-glutamate cyclase, mitochondrial-like [Styela clava]
MANLNVRQSHRFFVQIHGLIVEVALNVLNAEPIIIIFKFGVIYFSGTSNWGCYALACALYALRKCRIHDRYYRRATGLPTDVETKFKWAVPTVEREYKNLEIVENAGIKDGISPHQQMSVDGFTFFPTHAEKVKEMRQIINI